MCREMSDGQKRKMDDCSPSDRISELPEDLLENILILLSTRDIAAMSVLSKKWNTIWHACPFLCFDKEFFKVLEEKSHMTGKKIMKIINKVLSLRSGPISSFILHNPEYYPIRHSSVDDWISLLQEKSLMCMDIADWNGRLYELPTHAFRFEALTHLSLTNCEFRPPPSFKGFPKLCYLEFIGVTCSYQVFNELVSGCPILGRVKLDVCTGIERLEIDSPWLETLIVNVDLESLYLKNVPNLVELSVHWFVGDDIKPNRISNFSGFWNEFWDIKRLVLPGNILKILAAGGVPDELETKLHYLEHFRICQLNYSCLDQISSVFCVMKNACGLAELCIEGLATTGGSQRTLKFLETQARSDFTLDSLENVWIFGVLGLSSDMTLIQLLLDKSPKLKEMCIEPRNEMSVRRRMKMTMKLLEFPRASPAAKIIFKLPEDE